MKDGGKKGGTKTGHQPLTNQNQATGCHDEGHFIHIHQQYMLVSSSGDDDGTYMNTLYCIIIMLVMMMVMVMMTMMMSHFLTIS